MLKLCVALLALLTQDCSTQEEDGPYRGNFIGKLNSYHHQVSGEVYAVDEWTLLLVNFNYDGTGDDTFFWAGDAGRPGPQGFIVADEHGKTNILERYYNAEIRLTLPDGKRISRIKWVAVYDIDSQNTFGDVYIPEDFEPPAPRALAALAGAAVSSAPVQILTASSLLIPQFRYDGSGEEVYFWTGVGPQPSAKGFKIPDEYGYLEPLQAYLGEDVRLQLPGGTTVFEVNWLAVWDAAAGRALATLLVPEGINVPPEDDVPHAYKSSLPGCKQLHRDYQVSWEVFGPQVTIELAAKMELDEYMAFGISGSTQRSAMVGADVAVLSFSDAEQRGIATDYNITALGPCVQVLGAWQGVCRDSVLGAQDSNQVFTARRDNGLTIAAYRRTLQPTEPIDLAWTPEVRQFVVWARGRLARGGDPGFHHTYPKRDVTLHLGKQPPENDCFSFSVGGRSSPRGWERAQLFDPALRVFRFALGPSGGARAAARGEPPAPLAWYVNGQLAPDLQLRRGLTYTFQVMGGSDPHSATEYHPLVVVASDVGGLDSLPAAAQGAARVLAGAHLTRRARLTPTAAGGLCVARHAAGADRRRDADYATFRAYNRSLQWTCAGAPALLTLQPNSTWPDLVYYHSFTHPGMGGRIFIVDRHKRNLGRARSGAAPAAGSLAAVLALASLVAGLARAARR